MPIRRRKRDAHLTIAAQLAAVIIMTTGCGGDPDGRRSFLAHDSTGAVSVQWTRVGADVSGSLYRRRQDRRRAVTAGATRSVLAASGSSDCAQALRDEDQEGPFSVGDEPLGIAKIEMQVDAEGVPYADVTWRGGLQTYFAKHNGRWLVSAP